jgi:hypothetical protein
MQNKKQTILSVVVLIIVVALIWGFASFNKDSEITGDSPLDVFAKCVDSKGVTMYGAEWCGHCANEKKAFGDSFKYIKYVECPDNIKLCTDMGINGYPTWIDGAGKKYEGAIGLKGLAQVTGCSAPIK